MLGITLNINRQILYLKVSSNEVDETGAYYIEWSKPERKKGEKKKKNPHQYSILTHVYGI